MRKCRTCARHRGHREQAHRREVGRCPHDQRQAPERLVAKEFNNGGGPDMYTCTAGPPSVFPPQPRAPPGPPLATPPQPGAPPGAPPQQGATAATRRIAAKVAAARQRHDNEFEAGRKRALRRMQRDPPILAPYSSAPAAPLAPVSETWRSEKPLSLPNRSRRRTSSAISSPPSVPRSSRNPCAALASTAFAPPAGRPCG